MKGSTFYGKAGAFKKAAGFKETDPIKGDDTKSESKRKAEEILSYSASGDVDANRDQALVRQQRIKDMSNEEYNKMEAKMSEASERTAGNKEARDAKMEANRAEVARRNAMSKAEKRREDRQKKRG